MTVRLNQEQRSAILEEASRHFGPGTQVRLFGSRIDDNRAGGDIDLYVESDGSAAELLDCELCFRAGLMRRLGDRQVDVVVHAKGQPMREIDQHALQTGILL